MAKLSLYSQNHKSKHKDMSTPLSPLIEGQLPTLGKRELEAVLNCLIADQLSQGEVTQRFERSFSHTFGYNHALAVNNPTAAHHLCLLALGIGPDDHVILSALSGEAAYHAASYVQAHIHLVDIEQNSFHPTKESILQTIAELRACLKEENKEDAKIVYIAEHSMGSPIPYKLKAILETGALVIENFTGLVGSEQEGEYFAKQSHFGICGLCEYDLITTARGAMIVSCDTDLYKKVHSLRYGNRRLSNSNSIAYDYCLVDFQAAIGIEQLSRLGPSLERRKKIALRYLETLSKTKHQTYFKNPDIDSYLRFPVVLQDDPAKVERYFRSLRIGISKITSSPLHHLMGLGALQFSNVERLFRRSVCVPLYPNLGTSSMERVCQALKAFI